MRKVIYLVFLAGSGVLVSNRGGSIPYLLFYFSLMLPILALAYSVYVYLRFKIVQENPHLTVKGEKVPCRVILANEERIPFTALNLHFYTERVHMKPDTCSLCLKPKEKREIDVSMYCKYRGTYPVGVKSVTVTDFLGLFSITYPMRTQVRITVRPRILALEQMCLSLGEQDSRKQLYQTIRKEELPDYDLRKYYPGDVRKRIHWKNSAKAGELLVRRTLPEEIGEHTVFLDLAVPACQGEERLRLEDQVMEGALAFAYDYCCKRIQVCMVYMIEEIQERRICSLKDFEAFYGECVDLPFQSRLSVLQVWEEYQRQVGGVLSSILVTQEVTPALKACAAQNRSFGREVLLVPAGEIAV